MDDEEILVKQLQTQDGILRDEQIVDQWYYLRYADVLLLDSYALG